MKKKQLLLFCSLMLLLASCEKETEEIKFAPLLTTGNATNISRSGAVLSGSIQVDENTFVKNYGILISKLESLEGYAEYSVKDGQRNFNVTVSNLDAGTTYYYCAYANNNTEMVKGSIKSFSTTENSVPSLKTVVLQDKNETSIKVSASLSDDGGSEIISSGFCWTKASEDEPSIESNKQIVSLTNQEMSATLVDLEPNTEYQIRAYASNTSGVGYSEILRVKTSEARTPVLSGITQTASSDFSVSIKAEITDEGTASVTSSGFCWSTTNKTPTIDDSCKELNGPTLEMTMEELQPNTTYYIRAFAVNEFGVAYSEVFTFKTAEAKAPTLSKITQTTSSDFSVSIKAEITDEGTASVTSSGFCWSTTNKTPTIDDSCKELNGPTLEMTMEELQPNTTYYIRAFAVNEFGVAYSEVFTFKTAEAKAPTLSKITQTTSSDFSVSIKAEITDEGTASVTSSGFCWSITNKTPIIDDYSKELDGPTLEMTMEELQPNTTYYIRAFAVNEFGTAYSEVFTFKTAHKNAGSGDSNIDNLPVIKW